MTGKPCISSSKLDIPPLLSRLLWSHRPTFLIYIVSKKCQQFFSYLVLGNGGDIQWCFSQVKGTVEEDVTEGELPSYALSNRFLEIAFWAIFWRAINQFQIIVFLNAPGREYKDMLEDFQLCLVAFVANSTYHDTYLFILVVTQFPLCGQTSYEVIRSSN